MKKSGQNIFLIGPMGSGKTTIGKQLARMFNLDFYDCDHELERLTGASVSLIFDLEGESGFRLREHQLLKRLTEKKGVLIATGGGIVCNEKNRRLLCSNGLVVYLKTSIENQLKRLEKDKNRPLLQAEDRMQRLQDLAELRNPLYDETAELVFITQNSSVYATAKALSSAIKEKLDALSPEQPHANS